MTALIEKILKIDHIECFHCGGTGIEPNSKEGVIGDCSNCGGCGTTPSPFVIHNR